MRDKLKRLTPARGFTAKVSRWVCQALSSLGWAAFLLPLEASGKSILLSLHGRPQINDFRIFSYRTDGYPTNIQVHYKYVCLASRPHV